MEHPQDQPINEDSHEHLPEEQEPLLELDQTLGEIDKSIKGLDGTNLTPEQQLRFRKIKEKVLRSTKKFLGVVLRVAAIGAIMGLAAPVTLAGVTVIDYKINHQALEETVDAGGQTIYTHPDERTTHYLNILTGRDRFTDDDLKFAHENDRTVKDLNILAGFEKFTDDDVERIERYAWEKQLKETYEKYSLPLPANIKEMSSLELAVLCFKDPKRGFDSEEAEINTKKAIIVFTQHQVEEYNRRFNFRSSADEDIYGLVWKLEEEGGNPRIRFNAEDLGGGVVISARPEGSARNHYDQNRNVIYIDVSDLIKGRGIIGEMSHAKQFKDNPLGAYFLGLRGVADMFLKGGFSTKGRTEAYNELYSRSGSLEYQAHRLIQPDLENRYPIIPYLEKKQKEQDNR